MKPQQAKTDFMDQPDQIVVPSCVCQFVEEDGIELWFCQQSADPVGEPDLRTQNTIHYWAVPSGGEPGGRTLNKKIAL
jgi:hypothetical protein